jgi:uncharacterized protein (TIGR00251 family)
MANRLNVRVIPNAGKDEITGWIEGNLKVKLRAVPEDGRANKALCVLLAQKAGCRPREVRILSGLKSRSKVIELPDGSGFSLGESL